MSKKFLLSDRLLQQIRNDHRKVRSLNPFGDNAVGQAKDDRLLVKITGKKTDSNDIYLDGGTYKGIQVITDSAGEWEQLTQTWGETDSTSYPALLSLNGPDYVAIGTIVEAFIRGDKAGDIRWYFEKIADYGNGFQGTYIIDSGAEEIEIQGGQVLLGTNTQELSSAQYSTAATKYIYVEATITFSATGADYGTPSLADYATTQSFYNKTSNNVLTRRVLIGYIDANGLWNQEHTGAVNIEPPVDWLREQGFWASISSGTGPTYNITSSDNPSFATTATEVNGETNIPISTVVWVTFKSDGTRQFAFEQATSTDEKFKIESADPVAGHWDVKVENEGVIDSEFGVLVKWQRTDGGAGADTAKLFLNFNDIPEYASGEKQYIGHDPDGTNVLEWITVS